VTNEERLSHLEAAFLTVVKLAENHEERMDLWGERMEELATAGAHADARIAALADAQIRTEAALARLADAQAHTDRRLDALIDIVRGQQNGGGKQ